MSHVLFANKPHFGQIVKLTKFTFTNLFQTKILGTRQVKLFDDPVQSVKGTLSKLVWFLVASVRKKRYKAWQIHIKPNHLVLTPTNVHLDLANCGTKEEATCENATCEVIYKPLFHFIKPQLARFGPTTCEESLPTNWLLILARSECIPEGAFSPDIYKRLNPTIFYKCPNSSRINELNPFLLQTMLRNPFYMFSPCLFQNIGLELITRRTNANEAGARAASLYVFITFDDDVCDNLRPHSSKIFILVTFICTSNNCKTFFHERNSQMEQKKSFLNYLF